MYMPRRRALLQKYKEYCKGRAQVEIASVCFWKTRSPLPHTSIQHTASNFLRNCLQLSNGINWRNVDFRSPERLIV